LRGVPGRDDGDCRRAQSQVPDGLLRGTGDVPVSGNYDGDGATDVAIFRPAEGLRAERETTRGYFGTAGDIMVAK
jgi:hypothetical protein